MDIASIPAGIRGVPAEPDVDAVVSSTIRTVRRLLGEGTTKARRRTRAVGLSSRATEEDGPRAACLASVSRSTSGARYAPTFFAPAGPASPSFHRLERGVLGVLGRPSRRAAIRETLQIADAVVARRKLILLGHLPRARLRRSNEALRHVAGLARELIRAATPQEVVRTVRSWADRLGPGRGVAGRRPVARAWPRLAASGSGKRAELAPRLSGEASTGASLSPACGRPSPTSGMHDVSDRRRPR